MQILYITIGESVEIALLTVIDLHFHRASLKHPSIERFHRLIFVHAERHIKNFKQRLSTSSRGSSFIKGESQQVLLSFRIVSCGTG